MMVALPSQVMPAHLQSSEFTPLMVTSCSLTVAPAAMVTFTLATSFPVSVMPSVTVTSLVSVERSPFHFMLAVMLFTNLLPE